MKFELPVLFGSLRDSLKSLPQMAEAIYRNAMTDRRLFVLLLQKY
jgi:hypothetical protein